MLAWLAPVAAALIGAYEITGRYNAPLKFWLSVWKPVASAAFVNASASALVVILLFDATKMSDEAILIAAGLGGPAVLRARLADIGKKSFAVDQPAALAGSSTRPFGPAALFEHLLDALDRWTWSSLMTWQTGYVFEVIPQLQANDVGVSTLLDDLEQFASGLQYDSATKQAIVARLRLRANEDAAMEGLMKAALNNLPGAKRRIDALAIPRNEA